MSAPELGGWDPLPGLLRDYELYWQATTDAPRVYHIACGLTVVGTLLSHHVYLPFGGDRSYPNLWALLLGPSSAYRKTSCVNKARKTLLMVHESVDDSDSSILPDEFSREALLRRLSHRAQGLLTYSEFSQALATFSRDYMAGTKETLADLYDSPERYTRLVGKDTFTLRDVSLSHPGRESDRLVLGEAQGWRHPRRVSRQIHLLAGVP